MLNFNIPAFIQSEKYLWSKKNRNIPDKKTSLILSFLILSIGTALPIYPLYTTIAVLLIASIALALLHEISLVLFLIVCFGVSYRIGENFLPFSFSTTESAIYILIFIYLRDIIQIDLKRLVKEPAALAFLILMLIRILTSAVYLPDETSHVIGAMRNSVVPVLSFLVSVVMVHKFGLKKILLCWIIIGGLLAILGIIQSNTGKFLFFAQIEGERQRNYLELLISGTIGMGRSCTGLLNHPNAFSLYLDQILMLLLAWYLFSKQNFERIIMLIISGIILIAIFYTFSRGGYTSAFISIVILMLLYSKKTRIIGISLMLLMVLFAVFIILPYFFIFYEQFHTLFYRIFLWKSGLKILQNDPKYLIYGIGPGNYMEMAGTIFTAHNVYLLYLVQNGIFALLSLLYFIFIWLKHLLLKYYKTKDFLGKVLYLGLFTSSSGYFLHEVIEHTFYDVIFLSIFGFWLGLVSQYEKECTEAY